MAHRNASCSGQNSEHVCPLLLGNCPSASHGACSIISKTPKSASILKRQYVKRRFVPKVSMVGLVFAMIPTDTRTSDVAYVHYQDHCSHHVRSKYRFPCSFYPNIASSLGISNGTCGWIQKSPIPRKEESDQEDTSVLVLSCRTMLSEHHLSFGGLCHIHAT